MKRGTPASQKSHDELKASRIKTDVESFGLYTRYLKSPDGSGSIFFSRDDDVLDQLDRKQYKVSDSEWADLFGIPKTAAEAYPDKLSTEEILPVSITADPTFRLLPFRLSLSNFLAEWEQFKRHADSAIAEHPQEASNLNLQKT